MKRVLGIIVGDGGVGKTSLLISYAKHKFPDNYVPSVYDNFSTNLTIDNENILLCVQDVGIASDYKKIRQLDYLYKDFFIVCFSLVWPKTMENIEKQWIPEIREKCPTSPIILVGTKSDLRDDFPNNIKPGHIEFNRLGISPIQSSKGFELKDRINAIDYIYCSSLKYFHLNEIF